MNKQGPLTEDSEMVRYAKIVHSRGSNIFDPYEVARSLNCAGSMGPEIQPLTSSRREIDRARELDQYLIYQPTKTVDGKPITMKRIHDLLGNKLGDGKLLSNPSWYEMESYFTAQTPRAGWAWVGREFIPGSIGRNYLEQTQAIADYLRDVVYAGQELPSVYTAVIAEFEAVKVEISRLMDRAWKREWRKDWKKATEQLVALRINRWFRENPVEVLLGLVVNYNTNRERLLENTHTWTSQISSYGRLVCVGGCNSVGISVYDHNLHDNLCSDQGVRFYRSVIPPTWDS